MSLQDELNKWASSPAGKKRIALEKASVLKAGKPFGQGRDVISIEKARAMAARMRTLYHENLPTGVSGGPGLRGSIEPSSIIIGEPRILPHGGIEIMVSLSDAERHRDSLAYPEDTSHGAYDIIGLLTFGWNGVSDRIHGQWHGDDVWNRTARKKDDFMQHAVDLFNTEYGNVAYAELNEKYNL